MLRRAGLRTARGRGHGHALAALRRGEDGCLGRCATAGGSLVTCVPPLILCLQGRYGAFADLVFSASDSHQPANAAKPSAPSGGPGGSAEPCGVSKRLFRNGLAAAVRESGGAVTTVMGPFDRKRSGVREIAVSSKAALPRSIRYPECRTTVSPPTDFDPALITRSGLAPSATLSLSHVFGFSGSLPSNLWGSSHGCLVFAAAAVVVVMDPASGRQRLFCGHDAAVSAVAVDEEGNTAASGQVGAAPFVLVWDLKSLQVLRRLGDGFFEQCVFCLAFGGSGSHVVTVGRSERQYLGVWDTATGGLMAEMAVAGGKSPAVHVVVCEPTPRDTDRDPQRAGDRRGTDRGLSQFVTVGNSGTVVFYTFNRGAVSVNAGGGGLSGVPLRRAVGTVGALVDAKVPQPL